MSADLKLADLIEAREGLNHDILLALMRAYPAGSIVHWLHGRHWQESEVIEHFEGHDMPMLVAENVRSGKTRRFTASEIAWYANLRTQAK